MLRDGSNVRGLGKWALCVAVALLSFAMPFYAGNTFALLAILSAMGACLLVANFIFRDAERSDSEHRRKASGEGTRDVPVLLIMAVPVVISIASIVAIIWASGAGL